MNKQYTTTVDNVLSFMRLPDGTSLLSTEMLEKLALLGFFEAPASVKYHRNYTGGLLDHSYTVANFLVRLTENNHLVWGNPRSPYLVGMFHDLCKIDQYYHNGTDWEYNPNTLLKGHGDKSVMLLSQFYRLTEEEVMCIRYHMGAFTDKEEWSDYTRAIHQYPNVLWTHQADMLASHVAGI